MYRRKFNTGLEDAAFEPGNQNTNNTYKLYTYKYTETNYISFSIQSGYSSTQSSFHRVDDMCKAVRVECVGTVAAVEARVNTEHRIVQDL